jgi:hypothetical protein
MVQSMIHNILAILLNCNNLSFHNNTFLADSWFDTTPVDSVVVVLDDDDNDDDAKSPPLSLVTRIVVELYKCAVVGTVFEGKFEPLRI